MSASAPALDGVWVPVAADVSGSGLVVAELRVARFIIEGGHYHIVDRRQQIVDRGALHWDAAACPCTLDLIGEEGPYAGKRMLALIELNAERLCVCYDLERCERPLSMQPQGEQLLLSITYARALAARLSS
jgi:uncharacterized protein (TIGR03067 family)